MRQSNRTKRRILSAGVGVAAITALAGLACGNPIEPPIPDATPVDAPPFDATAVDAGVDAPIDAPAAIQKP